MYILHKYKNDMLCNRRKLYCVQISNLYIFTYTLHSIKKIKKCKKENTILNFFCLFCMQGKDNEELRQVIMNGWKSLDLSPDVSIMEYIASFRKALSQWSREHNLNSEKLVEELKEKVEGLYSNDDATTEKITRPLKELSDALKAEEMFWKKKSRVFLVKKRR